MENGRIAVPSNGLGGMDGTRAGHFGHCDCFTFFDVEDGEIKEITTLQNQEHSQGGCMVPVNLLADNNVKYLIVGGIGMRPLMGFKQVGIKVYHEDKQEAIKPVVEAMLEGKLAEIEDNQVCGGGGGQ